MYTTGWIPALLGDRSRLVWGAQACILWATGRPRFELVPLTSCQDSEHPESHYERPRPLSLLVSSTIPSSRVVHEVGLFECVSWQSRGWEATRLLVYVARPQVRMGVLREWTESSSLDVGRLTWNNSWAFSRSILSIKCTMTQFGHQVFQDPTGQYVTTKYSLTGSEFWPILEDKTFITSITSINFIQPYDHKLTKHNYLSMPKSAIPSSNASSSFYKAFHPRQPTQ